MQGEKETTRNYSPGCFYNGFTSKAKRYYMIKWSLIDLCS